MSSGGPVEAELPGPDSTASLLSLDLRDQAARTLIGQGWQLLYSGSTPQRVTTTLLDPSESIQISLQIPDHHDDDWNLWLEACHHQLSAPLRDWLQSLGVEQGTLSRLSGLENRVNHALDLSAMLQVARWLQGPIQEIEQLARDHNSQLVLHLAGLGPNS
ncbi:MAG: hypothetical protein EBZ29_00430 [Synechococcaceae bacterium WB9_4xC_028]|nr:hypothetical protein [Synechococcaceae bacterium WB9_4xB_025]NDD67893.1 hypothetical protein [Synechococcaceae bacterium WB9_4xC_028]